MAVPVDVLERVYQRDDEAFAVLYEHYRLPLGSFLLSWVRNHADVDDLYQETFIRVWKHLSQPDAAVLPYFEAFLYTIARNRAYDYCRRQKLIQFLSLSEGVGESQLISSAADNPEEVFFYKLCLNEALTLMTPQYRECLVRFHHYAFSYDEIAAQLGIAKSTVSTNLIQARIKFREHYMQLLRALHSGEESRGDMSNTSGSLWKQRSHLWVHGQCLMVLIIYEQFYCVVPALLPLVQPTAYLERGDYFDRPLLHQFCPDLRGGPAAWR